MYSTFQYGASLRELAKVFGLPKHEVDAIAANPEATLKEDSSNIHREFYNQPLCANCSRCLMPVHGTGPGKRAGHTATAVGRR